MNLFLSFLFLVGLVLGWWSGKIIAKIVMQRRLKIVMQRRLAKNQKIVDQLLRKYGLL